jgi:uncharacterized protein involved in outer membrane biogenesis
MKALMRNWKKYVLGIVVFFVIFTLVGFFALPPILKSVLTKKLSESLHREVTIQTLRFNPYTLSMTVQGFNMKERQGPETFFSLEELFVNLQSVSVFKWALVLKEVRLKQPFIHVSRNVDLSYNFSDLLKTSNSGPQPDTKKEEKGLKFSLNNIRVEKGSVDFWDEPKQIKHTVRDLDIRIPFISNIPFYIQTFVDPALSVSINNTPYSLSGKTKVFADSHETEFAINIRDLNLPYYLAYLPVKLNFKVPSAFMDVKTNVAFIVPKDNKPSLKVMGDVILKEVAIDDEKNNPLIRLQRLDATIASAEPLLKNIHLSRMSIESPVLNLVRNQAGVFNVESRFPRIEERAKAIKRGEGPPLAIDVDEIELRAGKVTFLDLSPAKPFKTILSPIDLKVDHFSNGKDRRSAYMLTLKTEANENVNVEGELSVNPLLAEGNVKVKPIPLKKYSPYYSDKVLFDIEDGRADFSTRYMYVQGEKEPTMSLSGLSVTLENIRLRKGDETEPFIQIPTLSMKNTGLDLARRDVSIGEVSTERGMILVKRSKDGKLNLQQLFPPSAGPTAEQVQEGGDAVAEKPWQVKVARVSVDQYTAILEDKVPEDPATLRAEEVRLKAENLSTLKEEKGTLSLNLQFNQKGTVSIDGSLGIDPLVADMKVDLKEIPIDAFQPYFTDRIKILVQEGGVTTAGQLSVSPLEGNGTRLVYKGDSTVAHFVSIDKANAEDFLKWESLAFSQIDVGINPLYVHLGGIALTDFYARVIIYPDGTMNLQNISGQKKDQEVSPPSGSRGTGQEPAKDIAIGLITLQGGHIDFADNHIKPNYSVNMVEIGGRISGLSPEEVKTAEVDLRGRLEGGAPLEIKGKINPLSKDLLVDLNVKFNDIELSPLTPYSDKYVGYTIEKGKVSMDLQYLIVKRKLESQNRIFFDQLTLGDRVESPEATKLPIHLAISLLKDPKGEIRLDLPVTGSLDDPKFSVFRVVMQIIGNLLLKAATSPFALLGAVFGGGEQLENLEFDYGSADVKGPNENKVNTLIKIMQQRPGIKLDIEGHVDLEKDKEALRQLTFDRKIKAQKLKELVKQGQPAVSLDDVKIEPPEYPRYLKMAYKEEKFPKPKNFLGLNKDIPDPEMEKLMLTFIEIKESDLRTLATQRAEKVKELLTKSGNIEPERIFIVEAKTLAPEKKENVKDSRVIFRLK